MKRASYLLGAILMLFQVAVHASTPLPKKVLIVLTSHAELGSSGERTGFWLSELTHPYYVLQNAGFSVDLASPLGGPAPIDPRSIKEATDAQSEFFEDADLMSKVLTTLPLKEVNPDKYSAILFSGGHGAMWDFPNNSGINRIASSIYENDGVVAAVCHGPAALTSIKLSDGSYLIANKKVTGFTNEEESSIELTKTVPFLLEDKMRSRGAEFIDAKKFSDHVVSDKRVITGQNPQSAKSVGEQMVELLQ